MDNRIGEAIKAARLKAGLSQEKLAAAAGGRNVTQVNAYERGRSRPSPRVLSEIADALGVTADALLGSAQESTAAPSNGEAAFVELFKKRCAAALNVPYTAIKITIEVVQ